MRFFAHRLIHCVLLLAGVSILTFAFMELAPGSFYDEMRMDPRISPQTVAALEARYGLKQPLVVRYGRWLHSCFAGEFGYSFAYNSPAGPLLWDRARNTLLLTSVATAMAWLAATLLGIWSAVNRGGWPDKLCGWAATTLVAIPDLLLALALLAVAVRAGAVSAGGIHSLGFSELSRWRQFSDLLSHMFLPVLALALGSLPAILRHVRSAMLEVLDAPFMRAARALGIPPRRRLFVYGIRAAAHPLIGLIGFSLGNLLSASLLIKVVMSWPGLGTMFLEAILARDLYLVVGAVMFSTFFLVAGNFLADLLLFVADPRIRVN